MCAFEGVGFCSWGRQIVIAFFGTFFFFKFRVGVGKTGLSDLHLFQILSSWGVGKVGRRV